VKSGNVRPHDINPVSSDGGYTNLLKSKNADSTENIGTNHPYSSLKDIFSPNAGNEMISNNQLNSQMLN
jgi:hypothetical protein